MKYLEYDFMIRFDSVTEKIAFPTLKIKWLYLRETGFV